MARLPTVGGDINNWGTVLNEFLSVGHNPDGTLVVPPVQPPGGTATTAGNFVSTGGFVIWQTGLTFLVSATTYVIQNTEYTSIQQSITLDAANGSNPRIDVIGLDTSGTVFKVTGTAAASPSEPNVDPITQLQLAFVTIATGATTPTGISNTSIYAEALGSAAEWDWTVSGSHWVVASTTDPRTGTKCLRGTALINNDFATGTIGSGNVDINNFDRLVFYIKLPAAWSSGRSIAIEFLNSSSVRQGVAVSLADGLWGFSRTNITTYQVIVIPTIYFQVQAGTAITKLRFTAIGSGGSMACGIDDVSLQVHPTGSVTVSGLTQDQADARYLQLTAAGESIEFVIEGGGAVITTGVKGDLEIPFACTITQATLLADQSGSIVVNIWKDTYANFPPTVADKITASAPPTISTATKSQDTTLTGWTTTIAVGDILRFNVDSITTCQRVTLSLKVTRIQ